MGGEGKTGRICRLLLLLLLLLPLALTCSSAVAAPSWSRRARLAAAVKSTQSEGELTMQAARAAYESVCGSGREVWNCRP